MAADTIALEIAEITGKDVALAVTYFDASNTAKDAERLDGMVKDLCRLPYSPVKMIWERPLKRGKVTESCIFVATYGHKNLRKDFLQLAPRYDIDVIVSWSLDDGITTFSEAPNGRNYVVWDVREGFNLDMCRTVAWDRFGPRYTTIGDPTSSLLREVHRYDSNLPVPTRLITVARIRLDMFGEWRY